MRDRVRGWNPTNLPVENDYWMNKARAKSTYHHITRLKFLELVPHNIVVLSETRKGVRTGSMDCTISLTNPPKKKHMTAVNISPEWRQNQILRASLQLNPNLQQTKAATSQNVKTQVLTPLHQI